MLLFARSSDNFISGRARDNLCETFVRFVLICVNRFIGRIDRALIFY